MVRVTVVNKFSVLFVSSYSHVFVFYTTFRCHWYIPSPTTSGTDSMGHGSTCSPHFYKWLGTGGTVNRRTANKKLTKLYWPSRKRSPKRLIVRFEPKKVEGHDKKIRVLRAGSVLPTFAPDRCPPLSNSFRRHWQHWLVGTSLDTYDVWQ